MKRRIVKTIAQWYEISDRPLPPTLQKVVAKDQSLGEADQIERELSSELRRPVDEQPVTTPSNKNLASAVMRQITEEDYLAAQTEPSFNWRALLNTSGLAAAAALAVVLAFSLRTGTPQQPSPNAGNSVSGGASQTPEASLAQQPSSPEDGWKNPLDQEIEYVISDAKGALSFLADNFVPSSYLNDKNKA